MRSWLRPAALFSAAALVCSLVFIFWINALRRERVDYVTALADGVPSLEAKSPTGYVEGRRALIVADHNNESYQWIAQTQQMMARGEWRLRHVDYDNAPTGRDVRTASVYRWWLGAVGKAISLFSGKPVGVGVERAALWADPLCLVLLALTVFVLATRWFGAWAAGTAVLGLAALSPLISSFLAGAPDAQTLALAVTTLSTLTVLAGVTVSPEGKRRVLFFVGGAAGGIGLWISVASGAPLMMGVAVGAVLAGWARREKTNTNERGLAPLPWRAWALGGAVASVAGFVIDYGSGHFAVRNDVNHPFWALGWLALGELAAICGSWAESGKLPAGVRSRALLIVATLAVAAWPVYAIVNGLSVLPTLANPDRMANLPGVEPAANILIWIGREGFSLASVAVLGPTLLILTGAVVALIPRSANASGRPALAFAIGPVAVALAFAVVHVRRWAYVDAALIVLSVAWAWSNTEAKRRVVLALAAGIAALIFIPGCWWTASALRATQTDSVSIPEVEALVERDFAHWLGRRVGHAGAVVLAPPDLTVSTYFHGGLRGLVTPYPENNDGFNAAVRICSAPSADIALALVKKRQVTHIAIPSWDSSLDDYARVGAPGNDATLIRMLHQWLPPRWLRPVPYPLPKIPGFEDASLVVFEVVDVQDNGAALGRLGEYFIEMNQPDRAAAVAGALEQAFESDLNGQISRALVWAALKEPQKFSAAMTGLMSNLASESEGTLPWDRRVSLAFALAQAGEMDRAKEQAKRCLAEMDEAALRSLTPLSVYRFNALLKALSLEITDPELQKLASELSPEK